MNKQYNDLIAEIRLNKEFDHVIFEEPFKGENLIQITGDIVGREADEKLKKVGRKHGFHLMANELSIWETEEYFKQFGGIKPTYK